MHGKGTASELDLCTDLVWTNQKLADKTVFITIIATGCQQEKEADLIVLH